MFLYDKNIYAKNCLKEISMYGKRRECSGYAIFYNMFMQGISLWFCLHIGELF